MYSVFSRFSNPSLQIAFFLKMKSTYIWNAKTYYWCTLFIYTALKNKFSSFSVDDKSSSSVTVNIYLRSINDIDDYKMEFSVQVTFREQWNDERLKFDNFEGCKIAQELKERQA